MAALSNFHVVHRNPEEITAAKLSIFLRYVNSFESDFEIQRICGENANIILRAKYIKNDQTCLLFGKVSEVKDEPQEHSFKFSSDFDGTQCVLNTKSGWQLIGRAACSDGSQRAYNVTLEPIRDATAPFKELYADSDLTDFELRSQGSGEAVPVHRSILAVSSPILKTMVQRSWNEAKQGYVTVPEVSKATLEHFKKYIYLRELPDSPMDCAKLLPLIYLMPELGKNCTVKIVSKLKPEDNWEWLEHFVSNALGHKAYFLLAVLFKNMNKDNVNVLEEQFSNMSIS